MTAASMVQCSHRPGTGGASDTAGHSRRLHRSWHDGLRAERAPARRGLARSPATTSTRPGWPRTPGGAARPPPARPAPPARADVVVTSLPTAQALHDVATGEAGLASAARPGLVVIETSTLPIAVKRQARDALAGRGTVLLDCPLSGTGGQALTKDVVAYLSGPAQAKARARPVLSAMTRAVHDVGRASATGRRSSSSRTCWSRSTTWPPPRPWCSPSGPAWTWRRCSPRSPTGQARRTCSRSAARPWPPPTIPAPA